MLALACRAREGRSWLVRISLWARAGRARRGAQGGAQGRAKRDRASRHRLLVDRQRHACGTAAPSRAHDAPLRDPALSGPSLGPARLQRTRPARPRSVTSGHWRSQLPRRRGVSGAPVSLPLPAWPRRTARIYSGPTRRLECASSARPLTVSITTISSPSGATNISTAGGAPGGTSPPCSV
jgi:hypothetical protein